MRLSISPSEWNVLYYLLRNQKINSYRASEIINKHKKILEDYKEKLVTEKILQLDKYKKDIEKRRFKNKKERILKFEDELNKQVNDKFQEEFHKAAQEIEVYV